MAGYGIDEARAAGYSDAQILSALSSDEFSHLGINDAVSAGYSPSQILGALAPAPAPEPQKESPRNLLGATADVGRLLYDVPTQTMAAIGNLAEEDDPSATQDWRDRWREAGAQRTEERKRELGAAAQERTFIPGVTRGDIAEASGSTGFSLASMGAGLFGGAVAAPIPAPGTTAAGFLGASGAAAYKMDKTMFTAQLIDATNNALIEERGSAMTPEERGALLERTADARNRHALWEAGPEAVGNLLTATGVGSIFAGVGKKAIGKIVGGLAKMYGGELSTETVTQMGQQRAEVDVGLSKEAPREWTSAGDWGQSFKEVYPATMVLSTLAGGGGAIAGKVAGAVSSKPQPTDPITEALKSMPSTPADAEIQKFAQDVGDDALSGIDLLDEITTRASQEAAAPIVTPESSLPPTREAIDGTNLPTPPAIPQPDSGTTGIAGDVVSQQPGTSLGNAITGRGDIGLGGGVDATGALPQDGSIIPAGGQPALPGGAAVELAQQQPATPIPTTSAAGEALGALPVSIPPTQGATNALQEQEAKAAEAVVEQRPTTTWIDHPAAKKLQAIYETVPEKQAGRIERAQDDMRAILERSDGDQMQGAINRLRTTAATTKALAPIKADIEGVITEGVNRAMVPNRAQYEATIKAQDTLPAAERDQQKLDSAKNAVKLIEKYGAVTKEKEPWQMTKEEYVDGHYRSPGMHREGVRLAIERGDNVPAEVLADYPDMKPVSTPIRDTAKAAVGVAPTIKRTEDGKLTFSGYTREQVQEAIEEIHSIAIAKATKKSKGKSPAAVKFALAQAAFQPKITGDDNGIVVTGIRGNNAVKIAKEHENALRSMLATQEELNVKAEKNAARAKKQRAVLAKKLSVDPERDSLLTAIYKLGVAPESSDVEDIRTRLQASGNPKYEITGAPPQYLFRKNGLDGWDGLAERLFELGYLDEHSVSELDEKAGNAENEFAKAFDPAIAYNEEMLAGEIESVDQKEDELTEEEWDVFNSLEDELSDLIEFSSIVKRSNESVREWYSRATSEYKEMMNEAKNQQGVIGQVEQPVGKFARESIEPAGGEAGAEGDFALKTQTPQGLKEQQAQLDAIEKERVNLEARLIKEEKDRLEHEDIKRRSVAAASTFTLGGDAATNLSGQSSLFQKAKHYDPNQLLIQLNSQHLRPGEDTEQTRVDRAGLAANALLRGADSSLLGLALATDWIAGKGSSLLGKRVTSPQDLATLGAVLRDPRAETFRYFLVKEGKVVYHTAISSRMLGSSAAFIGKPKAFIADLKATMEKLGADGYYLMHNHPGRNVSASIDDVTTTEHIATQLPGFIGHVILDHTEFGLIEVKQGRYDLEAKDIGAQPLNIISQDPTRTNPIPHTRLDEVIASPNALASMADAVRQPDNIVLVGVDHQMHVTGIMQVSRESMKKGGLSALKIMARLRKAAGAHEIFAILPEGMKFNELPQHITKNGWLLDVHIAVAGKGVSAVNENMMAYQRGGAKRKNKFGMSVDQPYANYQADLFSRMEEAKNEETAIAERKGSPQMDMFAAIYREKKPEAKPEAQPAAPTPLIKKGDRFTDAQGKTWEVWNARTSLIEAFPVIDGKMKVNNQDGQLWATDARAKSANPEARTDFNPIQQKPQGVTPQVLSNAAAERIISAAADSVKTLRKSDVGRVMDETPATHKLSMVQYIKDNRRDLADEVDSVMAEDQPEIKPTPEQQATAILDRANVTGKDRLDIMRDFKDGKHSLEDLENAYPGAAQAEQPTSQDQAAIDQADEDLDTALGDLGDIIGRNFRATLTPEQEQKLLPVLVKLFDAAFRKGYYKFKEAARFVLNTIAAKFGQNVADEISIEHLQSGYIGMSGRYKDQGAEKARDVVAIESKGELGENDVTDERSSTDLERNRQDAEAADGMGEEDVRAGRDGDGGAGRPGVEGVEAEGGARGGRGVSGYEAAPAGERGDLEIYTGAPPTEDSIARDSLDQRSDSSGVDGAPIESDATSVTEELIESGLSLVQAKHKQHQADKLEHKPGLTNIRETLPILTEGQQEDVHIAETRFAIPEGYGMLFTNGTGTGKTFLGLGIIKRFVTSGKSNIIIAVPNDKIAADWQTSGKLLGLNISRLENTQSAGSGVVITTYSNFGQNNELAKRDWDLIVHDEAHYLKMDSKGTDTLALGNLRAISLHKDGASTRASMIHADLAVKLRSAAHSAKMARMSDDQRDWANIETLQKKEEALAAEWRKASDAVRDDVAARQGETRPRVLFLSATPFAYEKTVDWANGYLFDYDEGRSGQPSRSYNAGSNSDQFMMQHFGYRMRTGKLTEPDAKVDRGLMQRQFNTWMKKRGVLAGRMLDVKADYDRRFVLVDSAIGQRIDAALQWFGEQQKDENSDKVRNGALSALRDTIGEKFDYLSRRYLLEAIKAQEVIPHIREHMALGRKVVVFHDYKKGGGFNPFDVTNNTVPDSASDADKAAVAAYNAAVAEFRAEFKDLIASDVWKASSPITAFQKAFPGVLLFNGDVPANQRRANVEKFQDDASGVQVMLVQSAAGKEGISLHDTTGKYQRVLFNLGQPTAPTTAIQQEGRIYRTGQVTDAIFRYLNTGTNWEKWAFATTVANRASAAENLGMGEQARALKDAFIAGFEESDNYRAGMEGEGKGGKERDKAANNALTEYDRARAFYFGTQKKNSRTKAQEGADYFATPEPVGLKMMELADIRTGESVLEPSAGHGAIARWAPETADRTAIEPSMTLRPRLAMVFDGKIIGTNFEDLNVVNKYDAIVMNPPFGSGGRMAIDHLAKAATHLREGGRIVALIPTGPAADAKFDKWFYEESTKPIKPLGEVTIDGVVTPIYRGDTIESRASWAPTGKVTGWRDGAPIVSAGGEFRGAESMVSKESIKDVQPTGKRTESFSPTKGFSLVANITLPSVTFERAGTAVNTRIVVIERSANAPQQTSRDYTDATDINDLFDRMESLSISPRADAREVTPEAVAPKVRGQLENEQAKTREAAAIEQGLVATEGTEITFEIKGDKLITNAPTEKVTTNSGKELEGVFVPPGKYGYAQIKAIDRFTYSPGGREKGLFVRLKHIERPAAKFSQSATPARNPHTLSTLTAAIDKAMGQGFTKLLELTGKFKIISSADIGKYLGDGARFSVAQDQTETAAFKKWFGNSRVVDSDGKPLVVYHGTKSNVTIFEKRKGTVSTIFGSEEIDRSGHFFATNKDFAREFSDGKEPMALYLSIQKIMDIRHGIPIELHHALTDAGYSDRFLYTLNHDWEMLDGEYGDAVVDALKKAGYDGMAMQEPDADRNAQESYVVFDATQAKSATENIGTFDPANPDIRYSADSQRILAFVIGGQTFLVADNISSTNDNVKGILTHEISAHALSLGRSEPEFQAILKQFTLMGKTGNKKVQEAQARVPADTPAHLVEEESLGYYLEAHPDTTFAQKVIAWFKAQVRKLGASIKGSDKLKFFQWANKLTPEDIVAMASQALRSAPQTLATAQDRGTFLAGASDKLYSQLRVAIRDMNDKIFQGSAQNVRLHLMNNLGKYGIKKDEIFWTGLEDFLNTKGKVSKADVLGFLDENAVVTKDVVLPHKYKEKIWFEASEDSINSMGNKRTINVNRHSNGSWHAWDVVNKKDYGPFDSSEEAKLFSETEFKLKPPKYESPSLFDKQVLPGGRDYRELLITLPTKMESYQSGWLVKDANGNVVATVSSEDRAKIIAKQSGGGTYAPQIDERSPQGAFKSSHYPDQPNLIAHVRLNTRDDAQGRVGTLVEEFQSDASIAGSKQGFGDAKKFDELKRKMAAYEDRIDKSDIDAAASLLDIPEYAALAKQATDINPNDRVPSMPFVTSATGKGSTAHTLLSLKKTILHAIEQGHEFVSWTTGTQQKERYSLSKQVDKIEVTERNSKGERNVFIYPKGDGEIRLFVNNDGVVEGGKFAGDRLDEVVGKDISDKILATEKAQKFTGLDLDIGGEWADTLYGDENGLDANGKPSLMTQAVKEVARQLGIELKVYPIDIFGKPKQPEFIAPGIGINKLPEGSQPGFTITPELRSKVTSAGMPLFSQKAYSASYEVQPDTARNLPIDGAELTELRRAAAGIESAERGIAFTVNADGKAIVTGPARVKVPARFQRFANEHGLTLVVQRADAKGGFSNSNTAMPLENRESGALYFGEMGEDHIDRTDKTRFSKSPTKQQAIPGATQPPAQPPRQGKMQLQGGQPGNRASWDSPEPSMFDDLIYKLQDKHIETKRVVEAIKEAGGAVPDKYNPYKQEELFHGRASKRVQDFVNTELKPLTTEMKMRGQTLAELDQFLHARHAKEANALIAERDPNMPDGGSGMTNQEADDYFASLPSDKLKRLKATAKRVDAIIAKTREYYASYGLISRDTVDGWADMFQHYVPLMREDHDGYMGIGQGFSIKGKEVKHRTGSTATVVDIFANIAMQREKAIVRGEKNRVAVALAGLAKLNPNPDFWSFDKPPTERVLNEKTGLVEERIDPTFRSKSNVVVAKIKDSNGQVHERAVIFNEHNERAVRMAESMKNMDASQLGGLLGASAIITRYFASINTQYNPVFGVTNLVRDVQGMALNLTSTPLAGKQKEVTGHILSAAKGIYLDARAERKGAPATSKWAALWEELQDQGGMTGYRDLYRTSEDRAKAIEHELDPHNWVNSKWGKVFTAGGALKVPLTTAQDIASPLFSWLSDYNTMMEGATRLSIYKTAIDHGLTKQQAASLAKNTTVNFNRKGESGQQAGALYAFFNAAMQGTARIGETLFDMQKGDIKTLRLSKTGKRIVTGGVMLGVMQALALAAAGFDDDEPPEFLRERNLIIPIGWAVGGKKYISIPMPLGFHALPNIGRISTEFAMGGFKKPAEHVLRLVSVFAEAFNPIGSAGISMQTVAPTALDPFAALAENKDWTGKQIYKEDFSSMKPTPGFTRNKDTASVWSKFIAEGVNYATGGTNYTPGTFSPTADQIDYLFGQVTGGVGRETSKAFQTGGAALTGESLPTYKMPLVGRFYGDPESQSSQGNEFYSNLKEINLIEMELKGRREDGLPTEQFRKENPKAQLIMRAKNTDNAISKLRKQKRELIDKGAERGRVRQVEELITTEMKAFNHAVDKFEARSR